MVMEKVRPATVIIKLAIAEKMDLAPAGPNR